MRERERVRGGGGGRIMVKDGGKKGRENKPVPQLCRRKEKREVNKKDEREGEKNP